VAVTKGYHTFSGSGYQSSAHPAIVSSTIENSSAQILMFSKASWTIQLQNVFHRRFFVEDTGEKNRDSFSDIRTFLERHFKKIFCGLLWN
jgi:hypothetical protein